MVEFGGKAYLFGGRGVKPVEEFDPATNSWRRLGPTPLEIHHFQPVVYGDKVYVMTAMTGRYPKETPLETIYMWDPKTGTPAARSPGSTSSTRPQANGANCRMRRAHEITSRRSPPAASCTRSADVIPAITNPTTSGPSLRP